MKILVFADMRSPHAQGWVAGLESIGYEVRTVGSIGDAATQAGQGVRGRFSRAKNRLPTPVGQMILTVEALVTFPKRRQRLRREAAAFRPDIVHALRVSHEGVTALSAFKKHEIPVVVSVWGIDFTVQAKSDPLLRAWMRTVLRRAHGLHVDSTDDFARALAFGLAPEAPQLFAAGNFGVEVASASGVKRELILAPRGFNSRMKTDVMMEGLSRYLATSGFSGEVVFLDAHHVAAVRDLAEHFPGVRVLAKPRVSHAEYIEYARSARVLLSPALNDGMPVTVLDAVASRCVPVVFDLPSLVDLKKVVPSMQVLRTDVTADVYAAAIETAMARSHSGKNAAMPPAYSREANKDRVASFYNEVLRRGQ